MPPFNQLQRSAYADLVRRLFGSDVSLDSIAPEIFIMLALEDGNSAEWLFLKQLHQWSFRIFGGAGVGINNGVLIQNLGTGVLIVSFIDNRSAATSIVISGPRSGALPANYGAPSRSTAVAHDGRFSTTAAATDITNGNVGVATKAAGGQSAGLPGLQQQLGVNESTVLFFFRVLMPNQWILIEETTANAASEIDVIGYYRDSTRPEETQA